MKKIRISTLLSIFLASALYNPEPRLSNSQNLSKPLETVVSEITNYKNEYGIDSLKNFYERGLFFEEDSIYSLIDKTLQKKIKSIPKYLNKDFFRWVIFIESGDNPRALSSAGARGLMQITRHSWSQVEDPKKYFDLVYNPEKNIEVGIRYFLWLDNYCKKNHPEWSSLPDDKKRDILLASYNGGITRLLSKGWDLSDMPIETRNYVSKFSGKTFL